MSIPWVGRYNFNSILPSRLDVCMVCVLSRSLDPLFSVHQPRQFRSSTSHHAGSRYCFFITFFSNPRFAYVFAARAATPWDRSRTRQYFMLVLAYFLCFALFTNWHRKTAGSANSIILFLKYRLSYLTIRHLLPRLLGLRVSAKRYPITFSGIKGQTVRSINKRHICISAFVFPGQ